jgi:hypothetical protein
MQCTYGSHHVVINCCEVAQHPGKTIARCLLPAAQAVDALCELLGRNIVPLVTLCLDVASPAAAQTLASAVQGSSTLLHATIGGGMSQQSLSHINKTLHARREQLKEQSRAAPGTAGRAGNGGDKGAAASAAAHIRLRGQQQNQKQRRQWQLKHDEHVQAPAGPQHVAPRPCGSPAAVRSPAAAQQTQVPPQAGASEARDKPSPCIHPPKPLKQERSWPTASSPVPGPADASAAKAAAVFKRHDM